jgi:antitoxin CptB
MSDHGRLRWRCRRGMRELDRMLIKAIDNGSVSQGGLEAFEELLDLPDDLLVDLLMGRAAPADGRLNDVIKKIRRAAAQQT